MELRASELNLVLPEAHASALLALLVTPCATHGFLPCHPLISASIDSRASAGLTPISVRGRQPLVAKQHYRWLAATPDASRGPWGRRKRAQRNREN